MITTEDYEIYKGQQEGIIDIETFELVQKTIELSRTKRITTREKKVKLFTSLLECECGGRYHSTTSRSGNKSIYYYYRCTDCKKKFNAKKLENELIDHLINYSELSELDNTGEFLVEDYKKKLSYYERKKGGMVTQRSKIIQLFTKGVISEDELEEQLNNWKEDQKVLLDEIETINELISNQSKIKNKKESFKKIKIKKERINLSLNQTT